LSKIEMRAVIELIVDASLPGSEDLVRIEPVVAPAILNSGVTKIATGEIA